MINGKYSSAIFRGIKTKERDMFDIGEVIFVSWVMIFLTVLVCLGVDAYYDEPATVQVKAAIEECEKELPRHLNCEAVITAKEPTR